MQQILTRGLGVASMASDDNLPLPMDSDLQQLHEALAAHVAADDAEAEDARRTLEFARQHDEPFDRGLLIGHLTASALVVSADGERVLLLSHRKLKRWLQPGGHGDPGERRGEDVALREAREETGLTGLRLHPHAPRPLDVDIHDIPARPNEPAHEHLDLRYLVLANAESEHSRDLNETDDLRWFRWTELEGLGLDEGLRRALAKVRLLMANG
jgi:8-oxo-dGTP pyrophosphatase MutT (NUDIX family)